MCEGCGIQLDSHGTQTFQQVEVWQNVRYHSRTITIAPAPRYMCGPCIDKVKDGIPLGQLSFMDTASG